MLTQLRCPVRLSLHSDDALTASQIETVGTLYQKDRDRFHLLLTEPQVSGFDPATLCTTSNCLTIPTPRLLWVEFSPYRVAMTMQGNGQFSYRHLFEPSVFGSSRYWLQEDITSSGQMRLRNFTRILHVKGSPMPCYLLLEYELWSQDLKLSDYTLSIELDH